jgi:NAD(P)-dependent dehydrogenase (short-subunit alcohol dehydrogenase family)
MQGEHVVVLGGSRGIGLEVARGALARGAAVTIAARGVAGLEAAQAAIPGLAVAAVDATDEGAVARFLAGLARVDHLYHAAGAFVGGRALEGEVAHFRSALEPRLWGALHAIRAAAPRMPAGGSIILTGGLSSSRPSPGAWATSIGTAAAEQMARALSLELAPIRVNAVSPGWTDTPMWDPILGAGKAEAFAGVAARLPIGRIAQAAEVADAVLFLMANRAVTGEVLHVDGGHRLV